MENLKKNAGFTLVELIVVIAILGILAGVGTVAYTGYVEKAQEAADQQLLSAVNLAFASACIDSGTDMNTLTTATVSLGGDKKVTGASSTEISDSNFSENFMKYFAGNENSAFKRFIRLDFKAETHRFVGSTGSTNHYNYGGGIIKISGDDVDKLKKSTFITSEDLGVEGLMNKVNSVTDFAAGITSSGMMNAVFNSLDFQNYALSALGITLGEGQNAGEVLYAELSRLGENDNTKMSKIQANAAVLYAANKAVAMDTNDIMNMLQGDNIVNSITGSLSTDTSEAMAKAALAYGMYTAYTYSDKCTDTTKRDLDAASAVLNLDSDEGFKAYMKTTQAQTDLEGYLAALKMINDSTDDTAAVSEAVTKGFNDPALIEIINQAVK